MIENLTVKNIALIEDISIDFTSGFNILTGETGAGKSILVGALGLLLGNKADADLIRNGKDEAMVSATFLLENHSEAKAWLSERAIEISDNYLILRRTLRRQGRGAIYIGSTPVTQQDLSDFTDLLVDMHSQHAHQSLLRADNHRKLLDHYSNLDSEVATLSELYYSLTKLKDEKSSLLKSHGEREREIDYLQFAINEIEEAKLKENEDEKLEAEFKVASQAEKLFSHVERFSSAVAVSQNAAIANLREGVSALQQIVSIDNSQAELLDRFQSAFFEIEDISNSISSLQHSIDFSPSTIDALQSRIASIHRITKKYGGSITKTHEFLNESKMKLDKLQNSSLSLDELDKEIAQLEAKIRDLALKVSGIRKEQAKILEVQISKNLFELGMKNAQFIISVSVRTLEGGGPGCGPYGIDLIKFEFSANAGEPLKELRSIASGGELSRVMLSIKSVFADKDPISTLVFDEIDTGIGGAVALSVGDYIAQLGKIKQILCITHLASIAAKASAHYQIVKSTTDGVTRTEIIRLEGEERIREIARMLSGDSVTSISLEHAKQMLYDSNR